MKKFAIAAAILILAVTTGLIYKNHRDSVTCTNRGMTVKCLPQGICNVPDDGTVSCNNIEEKQLKSSTTMTGRIVFSSCGSGCDGFSFIDQSNKYWQIATPKQEYNDYVGANKEVKVNITIVSDNTLDITSVELVK